MQRNYVASTSIRRHFDAMRLLGYFSIEKYFAILLDLSWYLEVKFVLTILLQKCFGFSLMSPIIKLCFGVNMVRILFFSTLYCLTEAMSYCRLILITYRPLFCVCTPFKAISPQIICIHGPQILYGAKKTVNVLQCETYPGRSSKMDAVT